MAQGPDDFGGLDNQGLFGTLRDELRSARIPVRHGIFYFVRRLADIYSNPKLLWLPSRELMIASGQRITSCPLDNGQVSMHVQVWKSGPLTNIVAARADRSSSLNCRRDSNCDGMHHGGCKRAVELSVRAFAREAAMGTRILYSIGPHSIAVLGCTVCTSFLLFFREQSAGTYLPMACFLSRAQIGGHSHSYWSGS